MINRLCYTYFGLLIQRPALLHLQFRQTYGAGYLVRNSRVAVFSCGPIWTPHWQVYRKSTSSTTMMLGDVEMIDGIVLTTLGSVSRTDANVDKTDAFVHTIEGQSSCPF